MGNISGGMGELFEEQSSELTADGALAFITSSLTPLSYLLVLIYAVFLYEAIRRHGSDFFKVRSAWACAVVLGLLFVTGSSAAQTKSLIPFYGDVGWVPMTWFSVFVMIGFAYSLLVPLFCFLRKKSFVGADAKDREAYKAKQFAMLFLILVIGWLPYIVAFAPGSPAGWDFSWQLSQFFGYTEYSAHHPLASTIIYGSIAKIGFLIGGDNGSIMAVVIFQSICFAAAFAFEISIMRNTLKAPFWVICLSVAFYVVTPIFGSFCQWNIKDSLFTAVFVCYVSLAVVVVFSGRSLYGPKRNAVYAALFVSAILVGLLRNNGAIVVFASLPFVCAVANYESKRTKIIALSLITCLLVPLINCALASCADAKSGSIREALSIPFQQTARYALLHSDEVDVWEAEAINKSLPYGDIEQRYLSNYSDNVKNTYREDPEALPDYFAAWLSQGLKHPETYLEATVLNSYGFWFVEEEPSYPYYFAYYSQDSPELFVKNKQSEGFEWSYWFDETTRNQMIEYIDFIRQLPIMSLLCQPGIYCWILLISCAYLVYRGKPRYLIIYLAPLLLLLTCIAGPVNGYLRYALGLVACAPLIMCVSAFIDWGESA